jgi:SAM-dependent MidA family methyltransferase
MSAPEAVAGSRLRELIVAEIRASSGAIPFSRYMEMCLYTPDLGYYARAREQFGKAGDFYTSSDVHAVFGRLLARQFQEMWRVLGEPDEFEVIELGPGRGLFAQDVLDWTHKRFPEFARAVRYRLVETSAASRRRLEERFGEQIKSGTVSVHTGLPELTPAENAIVFANELIDALPVHVLDHRGEVYVREKDSRFVEEFREPSADLIKYVNQYSVPPQHGERVEVCFAGMQYMQAIARAISGGFVILIDYGYTRAEQAAGRHLDTLMTYRRHTAGASPYDAPGEQDITAHVNFTALIDAGRTAGLTECALLTQAQFLMGIGEPNQFADAFEECRVPQEHAKVAMQLKHLVTPAGMGETFHVLLMSKKVPHEITAQLSGMRFAG